MDIIKILDRHGSNILTVLSCAGVLATSYLGIKTGKKLKELEDNSKLNEKEYKIEVAKNCIPLGVISAGTIACSIGSNVINSKQKAELISLCTLAGSGYAKYRNEVVKRFGKEVDDEIIATTISENCTANDVPDVKCNWVFDPCVDGLPRFRLTSFERDIIHAEMHFNRNYVLSGTMTVADFVRFLGGTVNCEDAERYGWDIEDEIYYVDFEHKPLLNDGTPTFEIYPVFVPRDLSEDYDI